MINKEKAILIKELEWLSGYTLEHSIPYIGVLVKYETGIMNPLEEKVEYIYYDNRRINPNFKNSFFLSFRGWRYLKNDQPIEESARKEDSIYFKVSHFKKVE